MWASLSPQCEHLCRSQRLPCSHLWLACPASFSFQHTACPNVAGEPTSSHLFAGNFCNFYSSPRDSRWIPLLLGHEPWGYSEMQTSYWCGDAANAALSRCFYVSPLWCPTKHTASPFHSLLFGRLILGPQESTDEGLYEHSSGPDTPSSSTVASLQFWSITLKKYIYVFYFGNAFISIF